ncbi:MAG: bifunctional tetrahydrofolate synthase/dihydrofolate synthase [Stagnimonas sp.]|nr:bifunctional tetrahydrofolate synthase/dihydrofolate synthase [Stagnimonas sp.]
MMVMPNTLAEWLAYQEQLHPSAIEMGLERVRRVASRLGLLEAPPRTIIVGGTNGKGSTTTLLALIYREAGYTVGAYTSPHLFRYNERVAINGVPVEDAALCSAFTAIEQARAQDSLTYFEFGTLAALWLFRAAKVDVQVLEVGLGGRLDAVNILDADAAIVTNIGLDHQAWLGSNRDAIGIEKAGIFRSRRPAIVADHAPPAGLLAAAATSKAHIQRFDRGDYSYQTGPHSWVWRSGTVASPPLPLPALIGSHQLDNAAGAIAVVQTLQPSMPAPWQAIERALQRVHLSGRMQVQGRFLLDVAHNAEAAQVLAQLLRERFQGQRLLWIAGVLDDKPVEGMAAALAPVVSHAITCDLPSPRGLSAITLASRLTAAGIATQAGGAPAAALALALRQAPPDQHILISGSFLTLAAIAPLISNV